MTQTALETSEDLSRVAFGFMASKALFAGLHIDLFSALADGPKTAEELSCATRVPLNRIRTLATALTSIGALSYDDGRYGNAPASDQFLVRGRKYDFGDYLRYQIDRQMYPFLQQLNDVVDGKLDAEGIDSYSAWMANPDEAALYSKSQHAGSLGPGRTLARTIDLSEARALLDVGGGTGAMTISLCNAYPDLHSTIIDFPNVAEIGWSFIAEAGLVNRVRYIPGNALEAVWPDGQDAVLMSYLLSGVPGESIGRLFANARESLRPGGLLIIHDFMVDPNRRGPTLAALWQLQHMAFTPDARSLSTRDLERALDAAGFEVEPAADLIPGMTHLILARKPA